MRYLYLLHADLREGLAVFSVLLYRDWSAFMKMKTHPTKEYALNVVTHVSLLLESL